MRLSPEELLQRKTVEPLPGASTRVLVVEDEPDVGSFLTRLLVQSGYDVTHVPTGQAALEFMETQIPDIIISDVMMPGQSGFDLCAQIRQDRRTCLIPIVLLSARADLEDRLKGFKSGADDYIVKPFEVLELKARLEGILMRSQRDLWCNPLSHLPASPGIETEVNQRLTNNQPFAFAYIDIDNFKSYNDAYGYNAGDQVIKWVARTLQETVRAFDPRRGFTGHIGGDDFVVLASPERMAAILDRIIRNFDGGVAGCYSPEDQAQKGVLTKNRQGISQFFPLMRLSIGIVNTLIRPIDHYAQLAVTASEVKQRVKSDGHPDQSRYQWDCRADGIPGTVA